MNWPPSNVLTYKMAEHAAWYSGEVDLLSNFYSNVNTQTIFGTARSIGSRGMFWGRQVRNQNDILIHVPIASDIAETSSNFLFGESPMVKIAQAHLEQAQQSYKDTQTKLDDMLLENGFFRKVLEAAEACAAIGGVFIKLAYDEELSPYPIPVVMQADRAIPEFSFGILTKVTFWKELPESTAETKYRLLETYEKGSISYALYKGSSDKLGSKVGFDTCEETKLLQETVQTIDELLAVYIPNVLPNRIDRNSYLGRSDLQGIERLMDGLDETFSDWLRDIVLAQAKLHIPESFIGKNPDGTDRYSFDQMLYVKLDMDPTQEKQPLTATQFAIRANEFEKSALNFLERIITSAGYSPQSFGLNIQGRAESGTALSMRERKSFSTKSKKQSYWDIALKRLVKLMILVYDEELSGDLAEDATINIAFSDGFTNDFGEIATSVKMISDAQAVSTDTKVRMLHPEWTEDQIKAEVQKIVDEGKIAPLDNPDQFQLGGGGDANIN